MLKDGTMEDQMKTVHPGKTCSVSEHEGKIKNSLDKESNRMHYAKFALKEMVSYFPTYLLWSLCIF